MAASSDNGVDNVYGLHYRPVTASADRNHDASAPPAKRRRASKACTVCYTRKVRCDLEDNSPCSNCRLDNIQCVERKRQFPLRKNKPKSPTQQKSLTRREQATDDLTPLKVLQSTLVDFQPASSYSVVYSPLWPLNAISASESVPPYFYPLPNRLEQSDINYLYDRGALTVPYRELQNALLESYVEYIHPYMPIIDLHPFLNLLHQQDPATGKASLLLYQTVMFAATAFVDMRFLEAAGFMTRKEARKFFFNKARLLYDFDYEPNRLVLVQCLLLMTFWHDTADGQKDIWHWIGVAVSMSHTIDLQRDPQGRGFSPAECRLRKRIWWSCFIRDRLIALATSKPTKIWEEDADVPMLTENDFEIMALPNSNTIISQDCAVMRDTSVQKELALMCIAKAKLCQSIGHIMKAQYAQNKDKLKKRQSTLSINSLLPFAPLNDPESRQRLKKELQQWTATLPNECRYRIVMEDDIRKSSTSLVVHRTLLHMTYQAALFALYNPWAELQSPMESSLRQLQQESAVEVRTAAMEITYISYNLHQHKLGKFLPASSVILLLPAAVSHIDKIRCPEQDVKDRAAKAFCDCMQVLNALRDAFYGADFASEQLGTALARQRIDTSSISDKTAAEIIRQMVAMAMP